MPSTSYTDPRLAALYDLLNTGRKDWDFYLALAEANCLIDAGIERLRAAATDARRKLRGASRPLLRFLRLPQLLPPPSEERLIPIRVDADERTDERERR